MAVSFVPDYLHIGYALTILVVSLPGVVRLLDTAMPVLSASIHVVGVE